MFKLRQVTVSVFNGVHAYRNFSIVIPLLLGLWSVYKGADMNWDLRNYHLYNPFALFNNKLAIDFAPGGFQNYFNPTIDIPYYLALQHFHPWAVAFLMGMVQGLNFLLVLHICRMVLAGVVPERSRWIPLVLAITGCMTANFFAEFGSTMGDNVTALFCLGSILLVLRAHTGAPATAQRRLAALLIAGLVMGAGMGLKLTNAPYAVALCLALLVFPGSLAMRLAAVVLFGAGVLCGIAVTNGYWFYMMWTHFGNPLFPQFGKMFPNPLAATIDVADKTWLPKSFLYYLLWPLLISIDSKYSDHARFYQIIWGVLYVMLGLAVLKHVVPKRLAGHLQVLPPGARYVLAVVTTGFFIWMMLFSIYRYLVPMDLIAPLAILLLLLYVLPYASAVRMFQCLSAVSVALWLISTAINLHRNPTTDQMFDIQVPPIAQPGRTTVLVTEGDPPWSWLALAFPVQVAFVQIEGNFPKGQGFYPMVEAMRKRRGGPTYALFHAEPLKNGVLREHAQQALDRLDLELQGDTCTIQRASIGSYTQMYQWCYVKPRAR